VTSIAEYHQAVKSRLIADPLIAKLEIRRERRPAADGHLRAMLTPRNGDQGAPISISEVLEAIVGDKAPTRID
jgi:hypothetical protein